MSLARTVVDNLLEQDSFVEFDSLPAETRNDIASELFERIPQLADHWSAEYVEQALSGLVDPVMLRQFNLPLAKLKGYARKPSRMVVGMYRKKLSASEAPPILVDGYKFIDGGHRVAAYLAAKRPTIPAVDIGPLLRMNWDAWLAGETDESHPVKSQIGHYARRLVRAIGQKK